MDGTSFATLTPVNAQSRLAFSLVYELVADANQGSKEFHSLVRMCTDGPHKIFDQEVMELQEEINRPQGSSSSSKPPNRALGMIYTGHYMFSMSPGPFTAEDGWTVGRLSLDSEIRPDLALCTSAGAKKFGLNISIVHARFNFSLQNRAFYAVRASRSPLASFAINGVQTNLHITALNQHTMAIACDRLQYELQYTDHSYSDAYRQERNLYISNRLAGNDHFVAMGVSTPLRHTRTIGEWTLLQPLGKGAQGKVSLVTNSKNEMAVVKMVERVKGQEPRIVADIAVGKQVTEMARLHDADGRILRQRDVVYLHGSKIQGDQPFDEVAIILEPATPQTMRNIIELRLGQGAQGMKIKAATLFRNTLLGIKVMHDQDWVHRDIKPMNIGVIGRSNKAVILNIDTARYIPNGNKVEPTPGQGGTVTFLAPEQELQPYDFAVDIWAMGLIGYAMTYNKSPWAFTINPWRQGEKYEESRPLFMEYYKRVCRQLRDDSRQALLHPSPGYIHLGALFLDMLRFPWARGPQVLPRISIDEVLNHPSWGPEFLLPPVTEAAPAQSL